jgi:hypothetical protein
MKAISRIQRATCSMVVAAVLSGPTAFAAAAADPPSVRILEGTGRGSLTFVVESATIDAGGTTFEGAVLLSRGLMVHRIVTAVVGADGHIANAMEGGATLEVVIRTGDAGERMLLYFSHTGSLELPRPLGLRLDGGDMLAVRGRVQGPVAAELRVRITLDFESVEGPLSRLAVLPVPMPLSGKSYEWRAPVDGRLMAFAGLPTGITGELVLEDVEAASVLWRAVLTPPGNEGFSGRSDVVRVGSPVTAGRLYRIRLHLADPGASSEAGHVVHGLLVPMGPMLVAVRH